MLNFDKSDLPVTLEYIENRITDKQIFDRYCLNFKQIDKDFLSEFYNDTRPSCRIYYNSSGRLTYHDFGTGIHLGCYNYVMYKFNCTFFECLNIIYNDFGLGKINIDIKPKILLKNDLILNSNINNKIDIIDKPFTINDYNYWGKYHISLELLQEYNVFSCSYVFLTKNDKIITFETNKDNPQYAYRFTHDGEYYYKIYRPLEENKKYKWLFSGFKDIIEGYDQLPLHGDLLILTKSLKDCMSYNICGYPAISLQGETNILREELVYKLLKRFNKIILNYDNDQEGIKNTIKINKEYGFKYFYIPEFKDLSDFIANKGLEEGKLMIKNNINQLHD